MTTQRARRPAFHHLRLNHQPSWHFIVGGHHLGQPHQNGTRGQHLHQLSNTKWEREGRATMRDAQAGVPLAQRPRAQLAFKDSMVHGILQFTPSIAFRYVLHRCESRDIRCRESFLNTEAKHPTTLGLCTLPWRFLGAIRARSWLLARRPRDNVSRATPNKREAAMEVIPQDHPSWALAGITCSQVFPWGRHRQ